MPAATTRTVDLLTGAFDLTVRRRFDVKKDDGTVVMSLYFTPITRADRKRASGLAGTDEALDISTQMLCHKAELEDGSKAFAPADAVKLQRELPEAVLNDLELFLFGLADNPGLEEAKKG
jgi:hypothetical protein